MSARALNGLARDLERWGKGLRVPPSEQDVWEFQASRAAAVSLKIDTDRLVKRAGRWPSAGAFTRPNTGRGSHPQAGKNAWLVKAQGPGHWAEYGTSAHWIVARGADTSKRAKRRRKRQTAGRSKGRDAALLTPDKSGPRHYGQYAWHPGTRARPIWFATIDRYWPDAVTNAEEQILKALEGVVYGQR